jgi:hydrogenase maturation factor
VVLKRSVLKELSPVLCKEIAKPSVGLDATGCLLSKDFGLLTSVATMEGMDETFVMSTFHRALNNIYVKNAKTIGITVSLMLRYGASEAELKEIMRHLRKLCEIEDVKILGGETLKSASAKEHTLTIQALGTKQYQANNSKFEKSELESAKIVMAGVAASAGTAFLYHQKKEELRARFSEAFLQGTNELEDNLSIHNHMEIAKDYDVIYSHDVSEGGIFTALWEVGEHFNCGMRVDIEQILFSQQTIEICEYLDLNPYVLFSLGCTLFVTKDPEALINALNEKGIRAAVVARTNLENDRIIDNGEEVRYLEPYKGDELYKVDNK